jgi:hypothetical protein
MTAASFIRRSESEGGTPHRLTKSVRIRANPWLKPSCFFFFFVVKKTVLISLPCVAASAKKGVNPCLKK